MKNFFHSFLGTLVAIVLLLAIAGGYAACVADKKPKIKDHSWLVLELYGSMPEYDPPGGIMSKVTGQDADTLQRTLDNLKKARVDDRIEGVILKLSDGASLGWASVDEIRAAIRRLQDDGKKVYAYAISFDQGHYRLLAACDEIHSPPSAFINFTGFVTGSVHVKQALEKLGIQADIHKIKDYKSAAELITREDMSEPAREQDEWLMEEGREHFAQALADGRGIDEEQMFALMEHALFTAEQAQERGLIDHVSFWDEFEAKIKLEDDEELRTVSQGRYAAVKPEKLGFKGKKKIAVVHAQGMIGGRKSGVHPLFGVTMGHETINAELRRARKDEDVVAVVFRVDSPGGVSLDSDLMSHEVDRTTTVKPVVVSMVDVAASGGYSISYRASKIVADPMTITGSIGSISGKFNMTGFYEKLGITRDFVTLGPNALMNSDFTDFTPEQRERFQEDHWISFNRWLAAVAERRGMSFEEAEQLAHGRVWTGRQAKANGLIDELGYLERAIELAKELAGVPADEKVTVVHYPKTKGLLQSVLSGDSATAARWAVYRAIREDVTQTLELLRHDPTLLDRMSP